MLRKGRFRLGPQCAAIFGFRLDISPPRDHSTELYFVYSLVFTDIIMSEEYDIYASEGTPSNSAFQHLDTATHIENHHYA